MDSIEERILRLETMILKVKEQILRVVKILDKITSE